jgi:virginiamycin B lyase
MKIRLLAVGAIATLCTYGCAQDSGAMPAVPSQGIQNFGGPARGQQPALDLFNTPSAGSWPDYIVSGPQHAMWFSEFYTDHIGRVTMDGQMTEFPLPSGDDIEGIAAGADGNIWFTEPGANKIGRMTPKGVVTAFPIAASDPDPRGITRGPDGNVWYVEFDDSYIGRVTPQGVITRFRIPDANSGPWAITTGPDGNLWFTESQDDRIGRFDPNTQQFASSLTVPTHDATPWGILSAPDKHIWFTERNGDKIAEVTAKGKIREFAIAQAGSYPENLAPGADGKLWFAEMQAGNVGNIDPKTGQFGPIVVLPSGSIPIGSAQGPNKNVWFCVASDKNPMQIGELVVR